MDGVAIMRAILVADTGVTALVAVERIAAGDLPLGTDLGAISIESVSVISRRTVRATNTRHVTERVAVSSIAATYPQMKAIFRAVRHAAADFIGTVAGLEDVTVLLDAAGPDFRDEQASIHGKPQDFIVGFNEPH